MPLRFAPSRGAASLVLNSMSRGPTGAAATIAVGTVTTGAAGSTASISNSGSSGSAIFNFTIPRGDPGTGDFSSNTTVSVDNELVLFSGTAGKTGKRASQTGIPKLTAGVLGTATVKVDYAPATSGSGIQKGDGAGGFSTATAGTDYLDKGTTSLITAGFTLTPYNGGTVSSGTYTPAAANGNYQYYTNNGAHTLAVPAADSAIDILVTNGASAGTITFSGYTVSSNTGDALTTTNTNKFIISIRRINSVSTYMIKALQ